MNHYFYFNRFTDRVEGYAADELEITGNIVKRKDGMDFDPFTSSVNLSFREDGMFADRRSALVFGIEVMKRRRSNYKDDMRMLKRKTKQARQVQNYLEQCIEFDDRLARGEVDIDDRRPAFVEDADF